MSAAEMPAGAAPGRTPDWHSIEWKKVWRTVRRLQARIVKAVKIRSAVNPYDPKWELYLEARLGRQMAQTRSGNSRVEYLWKEQGGRCTICGQPLRVAEEDCEIHHRIWRSRGRLETAENMELLHANCHRQIHVQERRTEAAASREGRS